MLLCFSRTKLLTKMTFPEMVAVLSVNCISDALTPWGTSPCATPADVQTRRERGQQKNRRGWEEKQKVAGRGDVAAISCCALLLGFQGWRFRLRQVEPGPLRMNRRKGSRQREGSPWLPTMGDMSLRQGEGSEGHPPAGRAAAGAGRCCDIPCIGPVSAGLI